MDPKQQKTNPARIAEAIAAKTKTDRAPEVFVSASVFGNRVRVLVCADEAGRCAAKLARVCYALGTISDVVDLDTNQDASPEIVMGEYRANVHVELGEGASVDLLIKQLARRDVVAVEG